MSTSVQGMLEFWDDRRRRRRNLFKVDAGVVHALLQARYYDGSKGEFLSEDPVFLGDPRQQVLTEPQGLNAWSGAVRLTGFSRRCSNSFAAITPSRTNS